MFFKFTFLLLLLCIANAYSATYQVTIEGLELSPDKVKEPHLIMLSDGRVGVIRASEKEVLQKVQQHYRKGEIVQIELDRAHNVLNIGPAEADLPEEYYSSVNGPKENTDNSVLPNLTAAKNVQKNESPLAGRVAMLQQSAYLEL